MANQTFYTFKANLKDLIQLQKDIDKAAQKLEGLTKKDKEYQKQSEKLKGLKKNFNDNAKAMAGATNQANRLNKAGGKLINTFKSAAVAIAAAFAVRAITGSIRSIITTFSEFEAQMAAVKAISGATAEEFETLEGTALRLGASTIFTATQVAQLQEEFARLGFTVEEIDAATASTLDLAAATGESLAKSAQIAGSTLRAFNMDARLTQNVTDVMAASFTSTALNLDRFTESMKFVAPVARSVGFTLEETTAILGQLANNGISGSIAGNSLKNILLRLGDANSKLSKKIGGPVQGTEQLAEAMRKLSDEGFSATNAVELLDKRSAPAFLALIKNIDGLEKSVETLNNAEGAVTKMAAIRLDTLQGDMTILKSATEGLSIALGDEFDQSLRNTVYSLTNFIQGITESESALNTIRVVIQSLGAALVGLTTRFAALGAVKVITSMSVAFKQLTVSMTAAQVAQTKLNAATKANPYIALLSVVTALASAYFLLGEEASEFEMKQKRLNDALNDEVDNLEELNKGTSARAQAMRKFKDEFSEYAELMDIELATQEQLNELRQIANESLDLRTETAEMENNIKLLQEEKKLKEEGQKSRISEIDSLITKINISDRMRTALINERAGLVKTIQQRDEDIASMTEQVAVNKATLDKMLSDSNVYQELKLSGNDSYRTQLRKFYDEELKMFRKLKEDEAEIYLKDANRELDELTWVLQYRDMLDKELGKSGELLEDAQANTQTFVDSVKKIGEGFDVTKVTGDFDKMAIQLTEMTKFVNRADAAFVRTGGSVEDFGKKAGFALNKTKDQFKKLQRLMDEMIENQFQTLIEQAETRRDVEEKANNEQIALMQANISNIDSIRERADVKELSALIKANKNKYNSIKTLTEQQFSDATSGEKKHADEMLKILDDMIAEENDKLVNAGLLQKQIILNYQDEIEKIALQRELGFAEQVFEESQLEANELQKSEDTYFKSLAVRKDARDKFAQEQIDNITADYERREGKLDDLLDSGKISQEEYNQAIDELLLESSNKITEIRQNQKSQDVADHQAAVMKVQEYYNMAFDAFSTFMSNRFALERQLTTEFFQQQSDDLDTSMQRELDAVGDNEAAKQDIRERYAILEEDNEERKQQALRAIKKKEFQMDKVNDIISATINGYLAITKVAGETGLAAIVAAPIMSAFVAAQIAAIASQKFVGAKGGLIPGDKFANGGMVHGPSHANGGVKFAVGGRVAELEGGEAVINKRSTAMFRSQLSAMNQAGGGVKFAEGGIMPGTSNILQAAGVTDTAQQLNEMARVIVSGINAKEVIVTEGAITSSQNNVSVSELTSTIF